jgi:hypothetical protein
VGLNGMVACFVANFTRMPEEEVDFIVFANWYRVSSSLLRDMVADTFCPIEICWSASGRCSYRKIPLNFSSKKAACRRNKSYRPASVSTVCCSTGYTITSNAFSSSMRR